jgi:hypothetical protein
MKIILSILSLFAIQFFARAQQGCTDPQATNYNSNAVVNDGSCIYPTTTLVTNFCTFLSTPLLDECSGLQNVNGNLWTHPNHIDTNIYRIDSLTNTIFQTVSLNTTNYDWEDMAASDDALFVGDFGNNSGNRTDLHILKIALSDLTTAATNASVQQINFTYADQTSFTSNLNNTPWDCEAFFYHNDTLHLFTKDWVTKWTKHYVLPAVAGTYVAQLRDSFNVNGLITSAAIDSNGVIVLLGYDNVIPAPCFIWMLYDYQYENYFTGNKRRFSIGTALTKGQVEGIDFIAPGKGYITNERFQQSIFNVPPQLAKFNLTPYLPSTAAAILDFNKASNISISPVPATSELHIDFDNEQLSTYSITVTDVAGKTILLSEMKSGHCILDISQFLTGIYFGTLTAANGATTNFKFVKQ